MLSTWVMMRMFDLSCSHRVVTVVDPMYFKYQAITSDRCL